MRVIKRFCLCFFSSRFFPLFIAITLAYFLNNKVNIFADIGIILGILLTSLRKKRPKHRRK